MERAVTPQDAVTALLRHTGRHGYVATSSLPTSMAFSSR
jgi:hypothetical protein